VTKKTKHLSGKKVRRCLMKKHEKEIYLDTLQKYDDYNCFEMPKEYKEYDNRFTKDRESFKLALEKLTNLSLAYIFVQDASYSGRLVNKDTNQLVMSLRFSNFGRLVTLHSRYSMENKRYLVDFKDMPFTENELVNLLEQHNFKYVPLDILYLPYDGVNANLPHLKNLDDYSWWHRYFEHT